jgi:hypothetical protein
MRSSYPKGQSVGQFPQLIELSRKINEANSIMFGLVNECYNDNPIF